MLRITIAGIALFALCASAGAQDTAMDQGEYAALTNLCRMHGQSAGILWDAKQRGLNLPVSDAMRARPAQAAMMDWTRAYVQTTAASRSDTISVVFGTCMDQMQRLEREVKAGMTPKVN
jgi:hypothetical protein